MIKDTDAVRFEMRTRRHWVQAVDHWRRTQDPIPSRSAAIQQLVNDGLFAIKIADELATVVKEDEREKRINYFFHELFTKRRLQTVGLHLFDSSTVIDPEPDDL